MTDESAATVSDILCIARKQPIMNYYEGLVSS